MKLVLFHELPEYGYRYSRTHLWRLIRAGRFPEPLRLGIGPHGRIAWDEEAILAARARAEAEARHRAASRPVVAITSGNRKTARQGSLFAPSPDTSKRGAR
jgi:predicted DNA-binding transcriptional regulator AlpA